MLEDILSYEIYIKPGITDMRKRGESLSYLVKEEMGKNPYEKSIFLFSGRDKRRIGAIVWDENGFIEVSKKLQCAQCFTWPKTTEMALRVTKEEVIEMLKGGNPLRRFPTV